MFYDLNIVYPVTQSNLNTGMNPQVEPRKIGYQVVAYNYIVSGKKSAKMANPIKKIEAYDIHATASVPSSSSLLNNKKSLAIQQLTRLTVIIDDPSQNYNIIISTYDVLAVQPMNEKLFQTACNNYDVDIISLELGTRLPFYLKHGTLAKAIERGIYFEICYAPAIRDSTSRRHLISNAQNLVRVTRGKNLIISSGAQKAMELRGPYDIVNLGTIMGMNQEVSKDCISTNCRAVLYRAMTRRDIHKSVIASAPISSMKPYEMWKLGRVENMTRGQQSESSKKRKRSKKAKEESDEAAIQKDVEKDDDDEFSDDGEAEVMEF
ncbi:1548_t:CDS:2 [Ambispora gerdemannii]|uniref:1548_t:CDS:1 n=1 Tax=Ambispora gerdemannii TaxID=144530 RepID=A0A9N8WHM6_9GLOM|nr:1548_t:CDS:2 [Ambispora gerdemannii]